MGQEYLLYGAKYLRETFQGDGSSRNLQLLMFPLVTMCDFEIRSFAKNIPYSVQCNLPINIYNAKIFLVVWYWLALTASLNMLVFAYQSVQLLPKLRFNCIRNMLKSLDIYDVKTDKKSLDNFVFDYLRADGYLTLKMIEKNSSQITSAMVLQRLWTEYKYDTEDPTSSHPSPALPSWRSRASGSPAAPLYRRSPHLHCNGHATVLPL